MLEHLATYRKWWYLLSIIVILPGVISLIFNGLDLGIDFTGGTIWEIQFDKSVSTEEVKERAGRQRLRRHRCADLLGGWREEQCRHYPDVCTEGPVARKEPAQ